MQIQNPKSKIQNARGASLIELTAALFVLTMGLLGTVQTYHFGTNKIQALREAAIAERAVQDEIEALRALPFGALTNRENAAFSKTNPDVAQLVKAVPAVTIRPHGDPALRLKEVIVSLRWAGENGRRMERSAATLITDK